MTGLRIGGGVAPREEVAFTFDGVAVFGLAGDSVAAALLAAGRLDLRRGPGGGSRGMFCAMGVCQECVVIASGAVREACRLPVRAGLVVTSVRTDRHD